MDHVLDKPNRLRFAILNLVKNLFARFPYADGLGSARYKLISIQKYHLYTKFLVSYNQNELNLFKISSIKSKQKKSK